MSVEGCCAHRTLSGTTRKTSLTFSPTLLSSAVTGTNNRYGTRLPVEPSSLAPAISRGFSGRTKQWIAKTQPLGSYVTQFFLP